MSYYHTCEYCGANLDPGEQCTCIEFMYNKYHKHNKTLNTFMEEIKHGRFENEYQRSAVVY